jgi:hypothetical protein
MATGSIDLHDRQAAAAQSDTIAQGRGFFWEIRQWPQIKHHPSRLSD